VKQGLLNAAMAHHAAFLLKTLELVSAPRSGPPS
jgi:hypothetical protein